MSTHLLPADTRMEDMLLWDTPLASGDTINLEGHVLTCETDLSTITGLYATGTGTIRLLAGGRADFTGSNPLPSTVTIEGGTDENPLPAHGAYGYDGRAAASLFLRSGTSFSGRVVSHCIGNSSRVQAAFCVESSSTSFTLDRDVDWEPGDVIAWVAKSDSNNSRPPIVVGSINGRTITHSAGQTVAVGALVVLETCGFVVGVKYGTGSIVRFTGEIRGDELGIAYNQGDNLSSPLVSSAVIGRLVAVGVFTSVSTRYGSKIFLFGSGAYGRVGIVVTPGAVCGTGQEASSWPITILSVDIGAAYGRCVGRIAASTIIMDAMSIRIGGGILLSSVALAGKNEFVDMELPSTLYSTLPSSSELVVRTTNPQTCVVHRASGLATLAQRSDFTVPTALPAAWLLTPIGTGTAWHDEEAVVAPGKTLNVIWHCFLGEEGARAGMQVLDGECPGFGTVVVPMGFAETLAETATAADTPTLAWLPPVRVTWRNESNRARKVVLRGWATGGTCYSRIDPNAGGLA